MKMAIDECEHCLLVMLHRNHSWMLLKSNKQVPALVFGQQSVLITSD